MITKKLDKHTKNLGNQYLKTAAKAKNELESIGFYFNFHPLNIYDKRLKKLGTKYGYEVIAPEFTETTAP